MDQYFTNIIKKGGIGAIHYLFGGVWQTFIRLGASIFLARFLTPADFGIYGVAMLAKTFIENLGKVGMGSGLIAKKEIDEKDLSTCFWFMAGVRLCLFGMAFLGAPLAAWFFNEPRMIMPLRIVALTFVLTSLSVVSSKILERSLKFASIVTIQNIAIFVESLVAVLLVVYSGLGYWSLVIGMLVATVINEACIVAYAGWMPKLQFARERFNYLFYFGRNQLGTNLNTFLQENIDYLVVGKLFGSRILGLYEFAYRIPHLFQQKFVKQIKNVIFPSMSKIQDSDEDMISAYVNIVRFISMVSFPALVGLFVLAFPTVDILWGEQWHPIVAPLKVLCIPAMISCLVIPVQSVFLCKHRPDLPFKLSLVRLVLTFTAVTALGYLFDLLGIAFGMLVSSFAGFLNIYAAFKLTDARLKTVGQALMPALVASLVMGLAVYAIYYATLEHLPMAASYVSSIAAGVAVYVAVYLVFFGSELGRVRQLMRIMISASAR